MTVKTLSAAASAAVLSGALLFAAGCTTQRDTKLPPGSYIPDPVQKEEIPVVPPAAPEGEVVDLGEADDLPVIDLENNPELLEVDVPADTTASKAKAAASAPHTVRYTIKKGDTLSGIAAAHKTTVKAIADSNGINPKSPIYPGKVITVPVGTAAASAVKNKSSSSAPKAKTAKATVKYDPSVETMYVVKGGDTLGGIAAAHSIRVADLASANNIDPKKPILVGQKLVIPKVGTAPAKQKAPSAKATVKNTKSGKASKPAPAAKNSTASAEPVKAKPANLEPANPEADAAAVLNEIGTDTASAAPAPAAEAEAPAAAAAPAEGAKPAAAAATLSVDIPIDSEMTLEEIAEAYEYPVEAVKKLNPNLSGKIPAGTPVKIPFF